MPLWKDKDGLVITTKDNRFCIWIEWKKETCHHCGFGLDIVKGKIRVVFTLYHKLRDIIDGYVCRFLNVRLVGLIPFLHHKRNCKYR